MSDWAVVTVPRVVAELIDPDGHLVVVHPTASTVIRQRAEAVRLLAETIQSDPSGWGGWSSTRQCRLLASRLLELRTRVRTGRVSEGVR